MIVLRGPGDQVASEGYELVGVAVQERVAVASPFHPDLTKVVAIMHIVFLDHDYHHDPS